MEKLAERIEPIESLDVPEDKWELRDLVRDRLGIEIPSKQVCPNHSAPLDAFAAAYFAVSPIVVWEASRGFGGKTVLLAALSMTEAITYGAYVTLLGGSGTQSRRVHDYQTGYDTNLPDRFWGWPEAPQELLITEPHRYTTRLKNGGRIQVLVASQNSVRGPHPQRLRLDEADETDIDILDGALGQAMPAHGIQSNTVLSSTHHNEFGTMTEIKDRAKEKGWPVFEWCYRETMQTWLTEDAVERKQEEVTQYMWKVEYDLERPDSEDDAILRASVDRMFNAKLGEFEGKPRELIMIEKEPDLGYEYVITADWAKEQDWTVIGVWKILDRASKRIRLVAFFRTRRQSWPIMIGHYNDLAERFGATGKLIMTHDATGIGNVVEDYLPEGAVGPEFKGKKRTKMLNDYVVSIENGLIECPDIDWMHDEHERARQEHMSGKKHLPDSIAMGALSIWALDSDNIPKKKEVGTW